MTTALAPQSAAGISYIGLDLTPGSIDLCQVTRSARADRDRSLQLGPAGKTIDYPALFSRIAAALRRRGFHHADLVVAAPPERCVSAVLEMPKATDAPIARLVQMELGREHRLDPATLESAWWDIPAPLRASTGRPVMSVGCPTSILRDIAAAAESAGLRIAAFDARSMALARAVSQTHAVASEWRLICDFTPGIPWVVIAHQGRPVIEHCAWESSLDTVYDKVAAECRTDAAVARQLCRTVQLNTAIDRRAQSFAVPRVVRAVRDFIDAASRGVAQCVQYYHHRYGRPDAEIPGVVIAPEWLADRFIEHAAASGDTTWSAASPQEGAARGLALWHGENLA